LLNEANSDLKGNAVAFPFTTTLYSSTASEFSKFNRALAARVMVYKKDWAGANTALSESFLSLTGDLKAGAYHLFSAAGGDQRNPLFYPPNSNGETRVVQPLFVTEATPGDNRLSKAALRTSAGFQDGLQSNYDFAVYKTDLDPISIIRNEELVLLYAEVKANLGPATEAVNAINRVRTAAGIGNYSGAQDLASLTTEILRQRRYSLFGEGHRWIDMRRYDRLNQLPIDRPDDNIWVEFPIPAND
jgi:hypothetical protein